MKVGLWPNHTDLRKIVIDHPTRPTESPCSASLLKARKFADTAPIQRLLELGGLLSEHPFAARQKTINGRREPDIETLVGKTQGRFSGSQNLRSLDHTD